MLIKKLLFLIKFQCNGHAYHQSECFVAEDVVFE